jgi:Domain of unknown function (DUF4336)
MITDSINSNDFKWQFWQILPLYPYGTRRTIRTEILKDRIWTFDQIQGILYVIVPIRMTVVKLDQGGLLVYAPVAPTRECLNLLQELVNQYGEVKYIILPTISGLEHKVFVGPFARCFPKSQVFVTPDQWSFPLNLPLSWLGLPAKRTYILPEDSSKTPFGEQFNYCIFGTINLGLGKFAETVFLDQPSGTLLVTDLLVSIPENPPKIVELEPYPLLFHAKESAFERALDTPNNRQKGWQRIALFSMYFRPGSLNIISWKEVFINATRAVEKSQKSYFGLFPFQWAENWQESFKKLRNDGKLLVAPVLQILILNRDKTKVLNAVEKVSQWEFKTIISCHLDAPINSNSEEFKQAFAFFQSSEVNTLPEKDLQILQQLNHRLQKTGILPPESSEVL